MILNTFYFSLFICTLSVTFWYALCKTLLHFFGNSIAFRQFYLSFVKIFNTTWETTAKRLTWAPLHLSVKMFYIFWDFPNTCLQIIIFRCDKGLRFCRLTLNTYSSGKKKNWNFWLNKGFLPRNYKTMVIVEDAEKYSLFSTWKPTYYFSLFFSNLAFNNLSNLSMQGDLILFIVTCSLSQ